MSDREENKEDSVVGSRLPRHRMPLGRAEEDVLKTEAELLHEELHHPLGTRHIVFGLHVDQALRIPQIVWERAFFRGKMSAK